MPPFCSALCPAGVLGRAQSHPRGAEAARCCAGGSSQPAIRAAVGEVSRLAVNLELEHLLFTGASKSELINSMLSLSSRSAIESYQRNTTKGILILNLCRSAAR